MFIESLQDRIESVKKKAGSFGWSRKRWAEVASICMGGALALATLVDCRPAIPLVETPNSVSTSPAIIPTATTTRVTSIDELIAVLRSPSRQIVRIDLSRSRDTQNGLVRTFGEMGIALCPDDSRAFQIRYEQPTQGEGFTVSSGEFSRRLFGDFNDFQTSTGLYVHEDKPNGLYSGGATIECLGESGVIASMSRGYEITLGD